MVAMKWFAEVPAVYLHREPVDFRQSINGLSLVVQEQMHLSPYADALFVFCNKRRDKLKVLHWDQTGFVLWYKRLEKAKFKWPRAVAQDLIELRAEEWDWLLRGYDVWRMQPHEKLFFDAV